MTREASSELRKIFAALVFAMPGWRFFLLVLAATPLAYYIGGYFWQLGDSSAASGRAYFLPTRQPLACSSRCMAWILPPTKTSPASARRNYPAEYENSFWCRRSRGSRNFIDFSA